MDDGAYSDWFDVEKDSTRGAIWRPYCRNLFFAVFLLIVSADEIANDDELVVVGMMVKISEEGDGTNRSEVWQRPPGCCGGRHLRRRRAHRLKT